MRCTTNWGFGFLESVYEEAMMIALGEKGLTVESQNPIPVWFRGRSIGSFVADLIVERSIIIELKAVNRLVDAHIAQLMNYLRATEIEVGLVMNFGPSPEFKRRVFENTRKGIPNKSSLIENLIS
jgi:GxxExxY protein